MGRKYYEQKFSFYPEIKGQRSHGKCNYFLGQLGKKIDTIKVATTNSNLRRKVETSMTQYHAYNEINIEAFQTVSLTRLSSSLEVVLGIMVNHVM